MVRDVRLFDGERVFEHGSVLVENGKISRIGGMKLRVSNAEIIDGRGRTLLPGLFDAHVHVPANPEPALRQFVSLGVTTALDMFGGGEKLKKNNGSGPRILPAWPTSLVAATSAPARAFHLTDRGLIRPKMRADLVLVEGDPTRDIQATCNIVAVWKRGAKCGDRRNVYRAQTETFRLSPH